MSIVAISSLNDVLMLLPIARALDGFQPAGVESFPLGLAHARFVAPGDFPLGVQFFPALPEADGEAGEVGRAEGGRLGDEGDGDGDVEDVCLKLHQEFVGDSPAVGANPP
jgi:hypothetical protein